MRLKELINEDKAYRAAEEEIREWVEKTYDGLSIEFWPHLEIVRTKEVEHTPEQVAQITEVINIKIGDILESRDEEIYIAERLTRIWDKHPRFNPEVNSIAELKENKKFLTYLKELIIRMPKKLTKEPANGKQ